MIFIYLLGLLIFVLFINQLLLKKKTLINETGDIHQKFSSKSSVPLTGGIFIFLGYFFLNDGFFSFIFFSFIILILGILSDLKIVKSAKKKIIVTNFIYYILCFLK